jgi:pimeloyl-ACP methyl ester carboxylesterase
LKPELKQRILKWTKRIVASIAVLLVALVLAGMSFQALESRSDRERFPPPGRLVDVGGHRLHLNCAGSGTPTVVLDSGAGGWSIYWAEVQERVSDVTRVCSYDRAGYGWSEPGPKPRIGHRFAEELNALLVNSGTPGPYVLVGHSLGGYVVRLYADRYPEEVAGVVLVESAHERQWTELPNEVNELMDSALGGCESLRSWLVSVSCDS